MELEDLVVLVMRAGLVISVALLIGGVLMTLLGPTGVADTHPPVNSSAYLLSRLLHNLTLRALSSRGDVHGTCGVARHAPNQVGARSPRVRKGGDWIYLGLTFLVILILLISLFLPSIRG
jgi:uncharacterized membrane protein